MSRVVDMRVSLNLLSRLFLRNDERPSMLTWVTSDVPPDAQIVGIREDPHRFDEWLIRVESETFAEVVSGHIVPEWAPRFVEHTEPLPEPVPV